MLADSSNNPGQELTALKEELGRAAIPWKSRLLMLALNFIPLLHILLVAISMLPSYASLPVRIGVALGLLYLAPPLIARAALSIAQIPQGHIPLGSRPFFAWWLVFQLQVLFCRLAALEEILRLVPGLYSLWLRLWGARIGRLTYWSPGTSITDRSFISIGGDVVLGAGARLNPHVLARSKQGKIELLLATVRIGNRAVVGGYSLLSAGTEISDDETTRAFLISPPFSKWKDGKRVRGEGCDE